jgi:regulator of RNase E activity RraB
MSPFRNCIAKTKESDVADFSQVIGDHWNAYSAERDGALMFVSFDEDVASVDSIANLSLCARIMLPIHQPNGAGGPDSPEAETLWNMEDELFELLQEHQVACRYVARLTYGGLRELVFQVQDWESFRPHVGMWMMQHQEYEMDVSEHEGWEFYNDYIRPRHEDRIFMMDNSVVMNLIEAGSDPEKEHSLEYVFEGDESGLERIAISLRKRGYVDVGETDFSSGRIVLAKLMVLDPSLIVFESLANSELAEDAGVEFNGWGASVVE